MDCTISALPDVHTADAQASVEKDRDMLMNALEQQGTSTSSLDEMLRELIRAGIIAARFRRFAPLSVFVFLLKNH